MRLGTEIRATIWVVLALQLVTAGGAIVLLSRMAPEIQNILEENVVSLSAVQRMQHALASLDAARQRVFEQALAKAEANVTEPEERPLLRGVRDQRAAALRGDPPAVRRALAALEQIAAINLAAMQRSEQRATRLGEAGAWAMAVLGMSCFFVSIVAARKAALSITRPLTRIHDTVTAFRRGEERRRCSIDEGVLEVGEIARAVDALLDERAAAAVPRRADSPPTPADELRGALLLLLDEQPRPTLVVSRAGEVLAASQGALDRLGLDEGLPARLRSFAGATTGGAAAAEDDLEARPVGETAWIVRLNDRASSA